MERRRHHHILHHGGHERLVLERAGCGYHWQRGLLLLLLMSEAKLKLAQRRPRRRLQDGDRGILGKPQRLGLFLAMGQVGVDDSGSRGRGGRSRSEADERGDGAAAHAGERSWRAEVDEAGRGCSGLCIWGSFGGAGGAKGDGGAGPEGKGEAGKGKLGGAFSAPRHVRFSGGGRTTEY